MKPENTVPVRSDAGKRDPGRQLCTCGYYLENCELCRDPRRNFSECIGKWDSTHCDWYPQEIADKLVNICRRCGKQPENSNRAWFVNGCDERALVHRLDAEHCEGQQQGAKTRALIFYTGRAKEARRQEDANQAAADTLRASGYLDAPVD